MRENVKRGAKLLDEADPGWFNHINVECLCMWDCLRCILGQRYGDYSFGLLRLQAYTKSKQFNAEFYGFDGPWTLEYWVEEIEKRKGFSLEIDEEMSVCVAN